MALRTLTIVAASLWTGLLCAAKISETVAEDVKQAKRTLEAAYDSGDVEGIRRGTTADHISITTQYQFFSQADQLQAMKDYKISSYEMRDMQVVTLTDDVALLTFRAEVDSTYLGNRMRSDVRIVETWVHQNGRWLQASYQQTPFPKSGKTNE